MPYGRNDPAQGGEGNSQERDSEGGLGRLEGASGAHCPRSPGDHPDVERLKEGGGGYRVRQGNWRAIYDISSRGNVEVIKVGHRREVYRQNE
jgi:ParE toxin of type II toxin-antitoxin system, parDE